MKTLLLIVGILACFLASSQEVVENYDGTKRFKKGLKYVVKENCIGLINKEGEIIVPIEYDDIDFCKKGYVFILKDRIGRGVFSLIDKKILIPVEYGDIDKTKNGFTAYGRNYIVEEYSLKGEVLKEYYSECKNHKPKKECSN